MQENFDSFQFYFNCLLKTNFFESTLGNLMSTYNFVDFLKNKKDFLFKMKIKLEKVY